MIQEHVLLGVIKPCSRSELSDFCDAPKLKNIASESYSQVNKVLTDVPIKAVPLSKTASGLQGLTTVKYCFKKGRNSKHYS